MTAALPGGPQRRPLVLTPGFDDRGLRRNELQEARSGAHRPARQERQFVVASTSVHLGSTGRELGTALEVVTRQRHVGTDEFELEGSGELHVALACEECTTGREG